MRDRELSLKAAARLRGLSERNVYRRRKEGLIRTHPGVDRRTRHLVYLDEFDEDIAALRCRAPGCSERAGNAGEFCSHPCSVRKYPKPQPRPCKQCGEPFVPDHEGHEFCSRRCVAEWRWENAPESFPQSERRGELITCRCGGTFYRPPSQLHHQHCEHCVGEARQHTWKAADERATRDLARQGLVSVSAATRATYFTRSGIYSAVHAGRLGAVRMDGSGYGHERLGLDPKALGDFFRDRSGGSKDAYRRLAHVLSAAHGTDFGRPRALKDDEVAECLALRAEDPRRWSYRALAERISERRTADVAAISHMAVKRALDGAL